MLGCHNLCRFRLFSKKHTCGPRRIGRARRPERLHEVDRADLTRARPTVLALAARGAGRPYTLPTVLALTARGTERSCEPATRCYEMREDDTPYHAMPPLQDAALSPKLSKPQTVTTRERSGHLRGRPGPKPSHQQRDTWRFLHGLRVRVH